VREAVAAIAEHYPVVLITKGDLFHQEAKIKVANLAELFPRIEIVSEKDPKPTPALAEFDPPMQRFVMVGNSLRSDIEPVDPGWLGRAYPVRGDLGPRDPARRGRRRTAHGHRRYRPRLAGRTGRDRGQGRRGGLTGRRLRQNRA
jgi:FMN phosphatase YigB (HAD superfamily)